MTAAADLRYSAAHMPRSGLAGTWSLRRKALLGIALALAYAVLAGQFIEHHRQALLRGFDELEAMLAREDALGRGGLAVSNAQFEVNKAAFAPDAGRATVFDIGHQLEVVNTAVGAISDPEILRRLQKVRGVQLILANAPTQAGYFELREALAALAVELDKQAAMARQARHALATSARARYDYVTGAFMILGGLGVILFGGALYIFFLRLVADLQALRQRAGEIVSGYRGEGLPVARNDEVGALMGAVNRIAFDLKEREAALEVGREQRLHREKMAALGTLAANFAHEIGNPLMLISAQAQKALAAVPQGETGSARVAELRSILEQTRGIADVIRQMTEFSSTLAADPRPVDAEILVGSICSFMRFDRRFRATRIDYLAQGGLPPLIVVPDELRQIVINLLLYCVDAKSARSLVPDSLEVATRVDGEKFAILIREGAPIPVSSQAVAPPVAPQTPGADALELRFRAVADLVERRGGAIDMRDGAAPLVIDVRLPLTRS